MEAMMPLSLWTLSSFLEERCLGFLAFLSSSRFGFGAGAGMELVMTSELIAGTSTFSVLTSEEDCSSSSLYLISSSLRDSSLSSLSTLRLSTGFWAFTIRRTSYSCGI